MYTGAGPDSSRVNDARADPSQPSYGCNFLYMNCLHFSICACHPCAGAMLIFSVSFQF